MTASRTFLPRCIVGVMGGGQVGRMFAIAARYADEVVVENFARGVDVLTFESENIPTQTSEWCARRCVVRPSGDGLHITQHRFREKEFLDRHALRLPVFKAISSAGELAVAGTEIGQPAVRESASCGYDGKGEHLIRPVENLQAVWTPFAGLLAVLESFVDFAMELSFTAAEKINLVGLLAVEMFLRHDGSLLINKLAPRPHHSGHSTLDACVTSQFAQQRRAVCGLPLGATDILRPAATANRLGDFWEKGEPDWAAARAISHP